MRKEKRKRAKQARYRRGDEHPRAVLTDTEVDLVRELHDAGWSYALLAEKFDVTKSAIAGICQCRRRA